MKTFSWYNIPDIHNGGYQVMQEECYCVYSKPNRKGGHTHNHLYNVALRRIYRSKNARDVTNAEKKHFRTVWEMNLKLNYHNSFCEFMKARERIK